MQRVKAGGLTELVAEAHEVGATVGPSGRNDAAALATGFSRALRAAGVDAPPSATIDFAQALGLLGITRPEHVFWRSRLLLRPAGRRRS